jgi:uncharacterized protein (TIGR00369 family)
MGGDQMNAMTTLLGINPNDVGGYTMSYAEHLIGNPDVPALHGGGVATLLETAARDVVAKKTNENIATMSDITVSFLKPAKPCDTHAHATIIRCGRRVATVQVIAWQESQNKPVASAVVTLLRP